MKTNIQTAPPEDQGSGLRTGFGQGLGYGLLGLPLAFVALPLYVHLPHLYANHFGMPLATLGAVLLLAHWDHFGECAAPPAEDLICNGAIDNASGIAALTEIARRLAKGPAMDRDVYFLATTAEQIGLLGAEAFADDPPLPLNQIVAAFNLDSFALAPRGAPLGIVGRGLTPLDPGILAVAKAQKRKVVDSDAANAYIRRQDGWALLQHDVPTVMVSSSWSDLARVERFFDSDYHRPGDQVKAGLDLSGTAEDVAFHVALVRYFGDLRKVPPRSK